MYFQRLGLTEKKSLLPAWTSTNGTVNASWYNKFWWVWCWVWEEPACNTFLWPLMRLFLLFVEACHYHPTHPTETKDTSMTATMLLHDSMLKPSVFRSPSGTQGHPPKSCKLHETIKETTVIQLWNVTQTNASYASQWFCSGCSSAPLGSLPCPVRQKQKHDRAGETD